MPVVVVVVVVSYREERERERERESPDRGKNNRSPEDSYRKPETNTIRFPDFRKVMAKTDSFFIRASATYNSSTFVQTSIDLGAFVDALGKSVLRIHNISVQYGTPPFSLGPTANSDNCNAFQLTTQSQSGMVTLDNKSVISSGSLFFSGDANAATQAMSEHLDVAPQHWTGGYLVAVEEIYLGIDANQDDGPDNCSIVLECTVEKLSEKAAMALALSQQ